MQSSTLQGVSKVTGLVTCLTYDPNAEPSRTWTVTIGSLARGEAMTAELALDSALREVETGDLSVSQTKVLAGR